MTPAVLGPKTRLNNFRLGYLPAGLQPIRETRIRIFLDGVLATHRVRVNTLTIHDILNDTPNTCQLVIEGSPPPVSGMALRITINSDDPRLLFNGTLQTEGETFEGKPAHLAYPCSGIDDTGRLNHRRPFGHWVNVSATTIAQEVIAQFAPGFTTTHVQAGLAPVTITFDGADDLTGCLRQLVKLIGGYFYVEDLDLHLFLEEPLEAPDPIDSTPKRFLHDPPIAASSDDSQLRTRVYGRGHGEQTLVDIAPGATTIPITDAVMFNPSGGRAVASATPDGAASERFTYSGTSGGGGGAIVGPGVRPTVAPTPAAVPGSGLGVGTYQYAYTFVTAAGESVPSPVGPVVTSAGMPDPVTYAMRVETFVNNGYFNCTMPIGSYHYYTYSYSTAAAYNDYSQSTLVSPATFGPITVVNNNDPLNPTRSAPMQIFFPYSNDPRVKHVMIWAWASNVGAWHLWNTYPNVTTYPPGTLRAELVGGEATVGPGLPTSNTTPPTTQVTLAGVALGPSGTLSRKVYRSIANGSQLKLQQTIANNTATTGATDTTADGALGATAPIADTSGLTQPSGQINPGESAILVTSTAPFPAAGGWIRTTAGEAVRYTGTSGNSLTGIPASGPGAILTTISYNDPIVPAPVLTGVAGLTNALLKGAPVYIWIQRDDFAGQAAAAERESTDTFTSPGIHEHVLVDERRGEASLMALCDAELQRFAYPLVTVTYATRDVKTKSGKPIAIDLPSPAIHQTLTIQDVTISEIDIAPGLAPRFAVSASSVRFSLEDTLRRLSGLVEV